MKQSDKIKKIPLKGRESHMINKSILDRDGDPAIRAVPPHLQDAYKEQGWEILTKAPVEAKKTRVRKTKTVKNEMDTDK